MGIDSHDQLLKIAGLPDDTLDPATIRFCRIEIAPKNGSYFEPDEWVFKIDMDVTPTWWTLDHKKACLKAHKKWLEELDKILIRKPIIHPFRIEPPAEITEAHIALLREWASVRDSVRDSVVASAWASVRDSVGDSLGDSVRDSVVASAWASVRDSVGDSLGDSVRASVVASVVASVWDSVVASAWGSVGDSLGDSVVASVWDSLGDSVRDSVWDSVWDSVRASVRDSVWAYYGSFFILSRNDWKYTERIKTDQYPFLSVVKLWEMGLVPLFDGTKWKLHGGKDARVLWVGELRQAGES
jgi:hypothetical protein